MTFHWDNILKKICLVKSGGLGKNTKGGGGHIRGCLQKEEPNLLHNMKVHILIQNFRTFSSIIIIKKILFPKSDLLLELQLKYLHSSL